MALDRKDLEKIEAIVFKDCADTTFSVCRSCDRIEARISVAETRIHNRFADLEEQFQALSNRELTD